MDFIISTQKTLSLIRLIGPIRHISIRLICPIRPIPIRLIFSPAPSTISHFSFFILHFVHPAPSAVERVCLICHCEEVEDRRGSLNRYF